VNSDSVVSVSVVIPAFNRAATIEQAVASAREQTRAPREIIVVDDASSDETAEVARRAGARVVRLEKNQGCSSARNAGIRAAEGDAIAWLDSDDFWEPNHIATVAALLDRYPEAAVASSAVRLVGSRSGVWVGRIPEGPPSNVFRRAFFDWLSVPTSTIIRRDALLRVGGWADNERYSSDFFLWMQLARYYPFVCTYEVTANWRWHTEQLSSSQEKQWHARYRFRNIVLEQLRADGEMARYEELAELFRVIWANDLQWAWDEGRNGWLKQLLKLSVLVPNAPLDVHRRWTIRSRIPVRVRPLLHELSRLRRASLGGRRAAQERP
jgi:glycosyltransferase involved in cell wall biosynthesis